jgi:hypothetical protein
VGLCTEAQPQKTKVLHVLTSKSHSSTKVCPNAKSNPQILLKYSITKDIKSEAIIRKLISENECCNRAENDLSLHLTNANIKRLLSPLAFNYVEAGLREMRHERVEMIYLAQNVNQPHVIHSNNYELH